MVQRSGLLEQKAAMIRAEGDRKEKANFLWPTRIPPSLETSRLLGKQRSGVSLKAYSLHLGFSGRIGRQSNGALKH